MHSQIAVAKPTRGREMRSTVIPKDVMDTVRAVSLRAVERTSQVDQLQRPREDDCEIYHEGYIDGKLYLVPDTNLQAMRDIVNLKMKRRLSSANQPLPDSTHEHKGYVEFNSRLDSLVDKVDRLALDPECPYGSDAEQLSDSCDGEERIPPILDENIKYKKVKPESVFGVTPYQSLSSMSPQNFEKIFGNEHLFPPEFVDEDRSMDEVGNNNIDIYRILLSGHIVDRDLPKIIVNLNYDGPNVFDDITPDFKQHAKDGNINIFVTGKFFTENILDGLFSSTTYLRVGTNKILVDDSCEMHEERFSDVFDVGPIDILLEGEFVKNPDTLKYEPTFTLEILKKDVVKEHCNTVEAEPTTVFFSKNHDVMTPFVKDDTVKEHLSEEDQSLHKEKHVHYAYQNEDTQEFELKERSIIEVIKGSKIYKMIMLRKEDVSENVSKDSSKHRLVRKSSSRMRRQALVKRKLKLKGRERQTNHNKARLNSLGVNHQEVKLYHVSGETKSPFHENNGDEQFAEKKRRKKKKGNIVNNPILAQMQQFFIT